MKRKDEVVDVESVVTDAEVMPKKLLIPQLATQLEGGSVNPATLSKRVLRGCALYFKSIKYQNADIAVILGVTVRTAERYVQKSREELASLLGSDFSKKIVSEIVKNWRARDQRLSRLSYAPNVSSDKRAGITYMRHKMDMDMLGLFERLGYLRKNAEPIDDNDFNRSVNYQLGLMEQFTDEQKELMYNALNADYTEVAESPKYGIKISEMYKRFIEENKRRLRQSYEQEPGLQNMLSGKSINNCLSSINADIRFAKPTKTTESSPWDYKPLPS